MNLAEKVEFTVNGVVQKADTSNLNLQTTLNYYLRTCLNLTGTKLMCQEGGCGACVVAIQKPNPSNSNKPIIQAANSCLIPVLACNGWHIQTIEGIADNDQKHHFLQKVLTAFNGTQCGFCSPGMIMNMYSLQKSEQNLTMKKVENSFGGHICRCTGYRPILSAFKSVCSDASADLLAQAKTAFHDIEEAASPCRKPECEHICKKLLNKNQHSYYFKLGNSTTWIKTFELNDLLAVLKLFSSYCLMAGNTSKGVYPTSNVYDIYVDITEIKELTGHKVDKNVEIGANTSLTEAMELFERIGSKLSKFAYLQNIAKHIDLIATVAIRNLGTLAGNLMLKHHHPEFPSDIFVILEAAGAKLSLISENGVRSCCDVADLLKMNMAGKVIEKIILIPLTNSHKFQSYKIMPRAQNAHAIVNAGFLLKINSNNLVESSRIVYGNITDSFVHVEALEKYLLGKNIFKDEVLQRAFSILDAEIAPARISGEPSPEFRKKLAISLFYKFILSIAPSGILTSQNKSGSLTLERVVSSGVQDLNEGESFTEPAHKIEALAQCSGQSQYIMDMPNLPHQLFGAFVLAKVPPLSSITKINASQALKMDGVMGFVDSTDIPGENSFTPKSLHFAAEEIFCSKQTKFFNQPVGLIVAHTQEIAEKAAEAVKVIYSKPERKSCITIQDVLNSEKAAEKIFLDKEIVSERDTKAVVKNTKAVSGSFELSWQYHFHMETQCCTVVPNEDNFDVYPASQWLDLSQTAVASALNVPANKVNVFVRRLGGAFGAKIVRNSLVACAAAVAANKFKKPVKVWMPFKTNMEVMGKRYPVLSNYTVEVDDNSVIQNLENIFYADYGSAGNEPSMPFLLGTLLSTYNTENWNVKAYSMRTDNTPNCYIRAPGSCEGLAMTEAIIEHAAVATGTDSLDFRLKNIDKTKNAKLIEMIEELKKSAEIDKRKAQIAVYNKENKWRKRGLSVVPMAYPFHLFGNYGVIVSIYQADGTVAIAHGGVEMGQGINTKAAQVCAYKLGIPVETIEIKPSNNLVAPNAHMVGGSLTSETVCNGVVKACDILLERMKPIREMNKEASWLELVKICCAEYVNLSATSMSSPKEPDLDNYTVYGVCAAEVELDVLTGQHVITRVDLIEDVGTSINTNVDIGQVEGAFVMGVGYFTCEKIVIEGGSGEIVTNRTWNYKPPGAKDIPVDFRVTFPKNTPNKVGVLNSKAMAEPPLCLACCVPLAIRNAVASVRAESGRSAEKWYPFNGPSTVEDTFMNCVPNFKNYTL